MIEYVFGLAAFITVLALIRGPTFADRALAAGALLNVVVIVMLLYAADLGSAFYLDVSVVLVFMSFVGTLSMAKYAGRSR